MLFLSLQYSIFAVGLSILVISAYLFHKKKKFEYINILGFYLSSILLLASIFALMEVLLFEESDFWVIIVLDLEMVLILFLFSKLYYIVYKRSEGGTFYLYSGIVVLFSHIFIAGYFLSFSSGSIIVAFIAIFVSIFISNLNEYRKRVYLLFGGGWYIYICENVLNELVFGLIALTIVSFIVVIGYRPFLGRVIYLYHSVRTSLTSFFIKYGLLINKKRKGRPLFWMTKVRITQIGRKEELEKKSIQTWLQDFFRKNKTNRVQIVLNKDQFDFSFLVKTKTKAEGILRGTQLLTDLKSTYSGLDGKIEHMAVDTKYLYTKEKWWVLKFPSAPYSQQIDLLNRLITLFGEDIHKKILLIAWKKAPPKKVLEQKAKILALNYKDSTEKETFLKMWRDELFRVKIYISYGVVGNNLESKDQEFYALKGRIKSLEIPIRNEKSMAKVRRSLCGARADFLRGNLFSSRYLTPMCFDFTFTDKMPLYEPIGLKRQVIKWSLQVKNIDNFSIGKWIDDQGRTREKDLYVKANDFVQGAVLVGQPGSGKSYLIGHIIQSISASNSGVGVLIINFKREYEENIYSADRFYKYGSNFTLPYIFPFSDKDKMNKELEQVSKALMGSIGFEEEGVLACKNVLKDYIVTNQKPPGSVVELLELVHDYFFDESHGYDDKFRARITSALTTRVSSQLSSSTLSKTLDPFQDIGQWYMDWQNGTVVQIDLTVCNEWEQRLLSTTILRTIRALAPDKSENGLKYLIVIDEAHRILKRLPAPGNHKSDDYVACEQIIKIFEEIFSEFRDRGISFLVANQRADDLDESVITLPSLKFLMRQSSTSVERFTKDPHAIETIIRLHDRHCVLDKGNTGEYFSFITSEFHPKKFQEKSP